MTQPFPDEPVSLGLTIMQLRDATTEAPGTCKWPHGDRHPFLFCGHATSEGHSYCAHHMRRASYAPSGAVYVGAAA